MGDMRLGRSLDGILVAEEEVESVESVGVVCFCLLLELRREVSWSRGTMEMVGAMERERRGGREEVGMVVLVVRSKETDFELAREVEMADRAEVSAERRGGEGGGRKGQVMAATTSQRA